MVRAGQIPPRARKPIPMNYSVGLNVKIGLGDQISVVLKELQETIAGASKEADRKTKIAEGLSKASGHARSIAKGTHSLVSNLMSKLPEDKANAWNAKVQAISDKFDLLQQRIAVRLLPVLNRLIPVVETFLDKALAWVDANPELITGIGAVVIGVGTLAAVLGPVMAGVATLIKGWSTITAVTGGVIKVFGGLAGLMVRLGSTILPLVGKAVSFIGRALIANPIGLAITAIAGAAYLIYQYWEPITGFMSDLWAQVTSILSDAFSWISSIVSSAFSFDWASLLTLDGLQTIWESIAGIFTWDTVLTALDWLSWILPLNLVNFVTGFQWSNVIQGALSWGRWVTEKLNLASWVSGFAWKDKINPFAWGNWISKKLNIAERIADFEWSDVLDALDIRGWLDFSWPDVLPDWDWASLIPGLPDFTSMFSDADESLDVRLESRAATWHDEWDQGLEMVEKYRQGLISADEMRAQLEAKLASEQDRIRYSYDARRARDMLEVLNETEGTTTQASSQPMPEISDPKTLLQASKAATDLEARFPAITVAANETLKAVQTAIRQIILVLQETDLKEDGARIARSIAQGIRSQIGDVRAAAEELRTAISSENPFHGGHTEAQGKNALPTLATVAALPGAGMQRTLGMFSPHYNMMVTVNEATDIEGVQAAIRRELINAEERTRVEARGMLYDG